MPEENKDDKENKTPAETVPENKVENLSPDEQKDKDSKELDEKIVKKQDQFDQLQTATEEETAKVNKLREERRSLGEAPITPSDEGKETEKEPTMDVKKEALDIFYRNFPDFAPANDVGNEKFKKIDEHFRRLRPGQTVSEVYETLVHIKDTYLPKPEKPVEEKPEGDIGVTPPAPTPEKQNSALTRKLNKHEMQAAKHFPGGEKEYRKELATKDE